jgi:hypothetical protein
MLKKSTGVDILVLVRYSKAIWSIINIDEIDICLNKEGRSAVL